MKYLGWGAEISALKDGIKYYRSKRYNWNSNYELWKRNHKDRIRQFKDIHKGKDCFIIGNGPSLNSMDLEPLNEYYTIGLNKIYLIKKKVNLDVKYLVAVNPFVIEQSSEFYENLESEIFLSYESSLRSNAAFNDKFNYLFEKLGNIEFSRNCASFVGAGYTVTFSAMQLAYFMGFSRVFLIGVDHSFNQTGKPNETQLLDKDDINHFDPDYFKGQKWQLADLDGSEAAYALAKFYFKNVGREIFDATKNGKLDIFDKISYEDALSIAGKR